ncbi:MAG TPA: hypothetical protein VN643_02750 [Pyrinomonadaceae bacterium]|nr:hypothetical protein [Pyrinomonadaceae bacterium]
MSKVRLVVTILVVFVLANFTGMFIHAIWLKQDYLAVAQLYRPDDQIKMPFIVLGYLSFAVAAVLAYGWGVEEKPVLGQGLRYGLILFFILAVPSFFIAYAVQPVPAVLMSKQVLAELVNKVLIGVVIALLYGKGRLGSLPSAP